MTVRIIDAKRLARVHQYNGVIIIGIRPDGRIDGVSYGADRWKCAAMGRWLDAVVDRRTDDLEIEVVAP